LVCYFLPVRDFHSLPLADLPAHIAVSGKGATGEAKIGQGA
jgi:hypothetical protein